MALLTQLQNLFAGPAPILGQVDMIPTPDIISAQILSTSTATNLQNGSPVKLVSAVGAAVIVDAHTGPTDAAQVFGFLPYNERGNIYAAGNFVEVACGGSYMYMLTSAAVVRGTGVSCTPGTAGTSDPTVATDVTSTHQIAGTAVDQAAAAGVLIRIKITPSTHA